jgi:hypothetical protein
MKKTLKREGKLFNSTSVTVQLYCVLNILTKEACMTIEMPLTIKHPFLIIVTIIYWPKLCVMIHQTWIFPARVSIKLKEKTLHKHISWMVEANTNKFLQFGTVGVHKVQQMYINIIGRYKLQYTSTIWLFFLIFSKANNLIEVVTKTGLTVT